MDGGLEDGDIADDLPESSRWYACGHGHLGLHSKIAEICCVLTLKGMSAHVYTSVQT